MADDFVQVQPDSTGKKVDTSSITVGANNVERQRVAIGDPATGGNLASVTSGGRLVVDNTEQTQPVSAASLPLPSGAAQDGTDGTGISQPTGGGGIRGWLSGIYKALTGTLTVAGTVTANPGALPSGAPKYGQTKIATANQAAQLPNDALTQGVIVQALAANVGKVYIGDSSVSASNGFELQAGQATSFAGANTNLLYVNGANVNDGVCFIGS